MRQTYRGEREILLLTALVVDRLLIGYLRVNSDVFCTTIIAGLGLRLGGASCETHLAGPIYARPRILLIGVRTTIKREKKEHLASPDRVY